jgi:cystathionine beta-lyase
MSRGSMCDDFDRVIDRRQSDSTKWHHFDPDVLSLWTADMDFTSPRAWRTGCSGTASSRPRCAR